MFTATSEFIEGFKKDFKHLKKKDFQKNRKQQWLYPKMMRLWSKWRWADCLGQQVDLMHRIFFFLNQIINGNVENWLKQDVILKFQDIRRNLFQLSL